MELRQYFDILRRSWWLVLGLPLLVALLTLLLWQFGPVRYSSSATMLITQAPLAPTQPEVPLPDYNNNFSWAASEYIVDDMLQLVESPLFAQDVTTWVNQQHGVALDVEAVQQGFSAERKHRTVFLEVEADQADHATWMAQAAVAMIQEKGLGYWARNDSAQLDVSVLERPTEASRAGGIVRLALDLVLRTLLAFLLALGIAFLRHYLDQTVRRRNDIEALGLEVAGMIPLVKGSKS
jgi:capsular polysaccharide biosynthesis protein